MSTFGQRERGNLHVSVGGTQRTAARLSVHGRSPAHDRCFALLDRVHLSQACDSRETNQGTSLTINKSFPPETAHHTKRAAALRGLARSVFINVVCTYLLYRLLEPHFHPGSLLPLALSGLLPLFSLAYGVVRHRSIDVIGLFAAEDIAVSSIALLLAHNAMSALVGRSLQNAVLGALFLCSVLIKRPIMLYVARQFITGNEASGKARFDQMAARSDAKRVYRTMTLIWSLVLFAKSVMSVDRAHVFDEGVSDSLACVCIWERCITDLVELPLWVFDARSLCQ